MRPPDRARSLRTSLVSVALALSVSACTQDAPGKESFAADTAGVAGDGEGGTVDAAGTPSTDAHGGGVQDSNTLGDSSSNDDGGLRFQDGAIEGEDDAPSAADSIADATPYPADTPSTASDIVAVDDAAKPDGQAVVDDAAGASDSLTTDGSGADVSATDGTNATIVCAAGPCDDGNPCTTDKCDKLSGQCTHQNQAGCSLSLAACSSSHPCKKGKCDPILSACVQCTSTADCAKGQACKLGFCAAAIACASDVVCKASSGVCNKQLGACVECVTHGDCAAPLVCGQGKCVAKAKPCSSSKQCTNVCDTNAGVCADCVTSADCSKGEWCDGDQRCRTSICTGGKCVGGGYATCKPDGSGYNVGSCDDGNICTTDTCEAAAGCTHKPAANGLACGSDGKCNAGKCGGAVTPCSGKPDGTSCGAGKVCKSNKCVKGENPCAGKGDGVACSDGDACTMEDRCKAGKCVAGSPTLWHQVFGGSAGDSARAVVALPAGGFAMTGGTQSSDLPGAGKVAGKMDLWLARNDSTGKPISQRIIGGSGHDVGMDLTPLTSSGFAVAGYSDSVDLPGGVKIAGGTDALLVRADASGKPLWHRTYGANAHDYARAVVALQGGGFALGGYTSSPLLPGGKKTAGNDDGWVVRTDAQGKLLWQEVYGGSKSDQLLAMVVAPGQGFALAGTTFSTDLGGGIKSAGLSDFWLVQTDQTGKLLWHQTYGGSGYEQAYAVSAASDGGFALAGTTNSKDLPGGAKTAGFNDFWLVRTSASGQLLWHRTYGGSGTDIAHAVVSLPDGGFTVAGRTDSKDLAGAKLLGTQDSLLLRTNAQGLPIWQRTLGGGGVDTVYGLAALPNGAFIVAGATTSADLPGAGKNTGTSEFWLARTDKLGHVDCKAAGNCTGLANGSPCSDGSACTVVDKCIGGSCKGVDSCDDGQTCTLDACGPEGSCLHGPSSGSGCVAAACKSAACSRARQLAGLGAHRCAVTAKGATKCWGKHVVAGSYGVSADAHWTKATAIPGAESVSDIAVAPGRVCVVKTDGTAWCWGGNGGTFGVDPSKLGGSPKPVQVKGISDAVRVSAGHGSACYLRKAGDVACIGSGQAGQLGDPKAKPGINFKFFTAGLPEKAIDIASGQYHHCAVGVSGAVYCWGGCGTYESGGKQVPLCSGANPAKVTGPANAFRVAAGGQLSCAIQRDGQVWCWGTDEYVKPTQIKLKVGASDIDTDGRNTCVVLRDGSGWCWGDNQGGILGTWSVDKSTTPMQIAGVNAAVEVDVAGRSACFMSKSSELKCLGRNQWGLLGNGKPTFRATAASVANPLPGASAITSVDSVSCALVSGGQAMCWGETTYGHGGNGLRVLSPKPRGVAGVKGLLGIAPGYLQSCAWNASGAMCFGQNNFGSKAGALVSSKATGTEGIWKPLAADKLGKVVDVSLARHHGCAIASDGTAKCWGANDKGQIGNGGTVYAATPSAVNSITGAARIHVAGASATDSYSCALLKSGGVKCWGTDSSGQLGDGGGIKPGGMSAKAVNVAIAAKQLAVSTTRACVVDFAKTVKCWGNGQSSPAAVVGFPKSIAVSVGGGTVCGVAAADGQLWCKGAGKYGQSGHNKAVPAPVQGWTGKAIAVSVGRQHACGLRADGTAMCWGMNLSGQLGDGAGATTTPVSVIGL